MFKWEFTLLTDKLHKDLLNGNIEEKIEYKQHTNINISNEQIGKFSAYISSNLTPLQILFFGRYMDIVCQISLINGM